MLLIFLKILKCFYLAYGLNVNLSKRKVYGIGVSNTQIGDKENWLNCSVGEFPFIYLGTPVGCSMSQKSNWVSLIDKFNNKLSNWKARNLSFGGRHVLCKAVLSTMGSYFSHFLHPQVVLLTVLIVSGVAFFGVIFQVKIKIRQFSWKKVLNLRDNGGLGIGSLKAFDYVLLAKWLWRF